MCHSIQVMFVNANSQLYTRQSNHCEFTLSAFESASGELESPRHTLPPKVRQYLEETQTYIFIDKLTLRNKEIYPKTLRKRLILIYFQRQCVDIIFKDDGMKLCGYHSSNTIRLWINRFSKHQLNVLHSYVFGMVNYVRLTN